MSALSVVAGRDSCGTVVDECARISGLIWKALLGRISALIVVAGRDTCGALKKPPAGPKRCLGGPSSSGYGAADGALPADGGPLSIG